MRPPKQISSGPMAAHRPAVLGTLLRCRPGEHAASAGQGVAGIFYGATQQQERVYLMRRKVGSLHGGLVVRAGVCGRTLGRAQGPPSSVASELAAAVTRRALMSQGRRLCAFEPVFAACRFHGHARGSAACPALYCSCAR